MASNHVLNLQFEESGREPKLLHHTSIVSCCKLRLLCLLFVTIVKNRIFKIYPNALLPNLSTVHHLLLESTIAHEQFISPRFSLFSFPWYLQIFPSEKISLKFYPHSYNKIKSKETRTPALEEQWFTPTHSLFNCRPLKNRSWCSLKSAELCY